MRRLQDRIAQLELELEHERGQATNFLARRQRPSPRPHRYRKGAPTIIDGVLRSRQATVLLVERLEIIGIQAYRSRLPCITNLLV
jgi:hypothetical protein